MIHGAGGVTWNAGEMVNIRPKPRIRGLPGLGLKSEHVLQQMKCLKPVNRKRSHTMVRTRSAVDEDVFLVFFWGWRLEQPWMSWPGWRTDGLMVG